MTKKRGRCDKAAVTGDLLYSAVAPRLLRGGSMAAQLTRNFIFPINNISSIKTFQKWILLHSYTKIFQSFEEISKMVESAPNLRRLAPKIFPTQRPNIGRTCLGLRGQYWGISQIPFVKSVSSRSLPLSYHIYHTSQLWLNVFNSRRSNFSTTISNKIY